MRNFKKTEYRAILGAFWRGQEEIDVLMKKFMGQMIPQIEGIAPTKKSNRFLT
jgi:succinate dehydrogenase flavin-adding protein (antitoxin of CptAB toxin-antitoxin module)